MGDLLVKNGLAVDGSIMLKTDLRLVDGALSNYISLSAPAALAGTLAFVLPDADGTSGQVLTTNGLGQLSFTTVSGSGLPSGPLVHNDIIQSNAASPSLALYETGAPTDDKDWRISPLNGDLYIYPVDDASTTSGYAYKIVRNTIYTDSHYWYTGAAVGEALQRRMVLDSNGLDVINPTSGMGAVPAEQTFSLSANGAAIGPTIANFFGAGSAISLEANTTYEITAHALFVKNTAGTATWTITTSLATANVTAHRISTPLTGAGGTGLVANITSLAAASTPFAATGSLTTGARHSFYFTIIIRTSASATNFRLNLTQSAGTATPQVGSYYTVKKISSTVGTFVV